MGYSVGLHYGRPKFSDFSSLSENWSVLMCFRLDDRITKNFSEPKPEFLKLFNIGRSLLGKASWRQSLEIKEAVVL